MLWTVGELKVNAQCLFEHIAMGKQVRLIFQSQILGDEATLSSCGVATGNFLHVSISDRAAALPVPASDAEDAYLPHDDHNFVFQAPPYFVEPPSPVREGTLNELICGLMVGFVFGPIMFIWMWQPLPRKQKLGMIIGVFANVVYSLARVNVTTDPAGAPVATVAPTIRPGDWIVA